MKVITDLHIHSRYSGGTSQRISIKNIALSCKTKGIDIVGTGDCLHPKWFKELNSFLYESTSGIYNYSEIPEVRFILQTELELIWRKKFGLKKVHFIVLIPNFDVLHQIYQELSQYGHLNDEGRPKIELEGEKFVILLENIDSSIEIIPAHIFTPYYGIYGTHANFNSLKDALGEGYKFIHAAETGLSADPLLVGELSDLNDLTIISNSDAHSLNYNRLGREATLIEMHKFNYNNLIKSIRSNRIIKTYEFMPAGGKYYYNGHRSERHSNKKGYFCSPNHKRISCPYCAKSLTKGVLSRVYDLKDQDPPHKADFQYIVPLYELLSLLNNKNIYDKEILDLYIELVHNNDGEYNIWEGSSNFDGVSLETIQAIEKIRKSNFYYIPGYDGVYGSLCLEGFNLKSEV